LPQQDYRQIVAKPPIDTSFSDILTLTIFKHCGIIHTFYVN